MPRLGCRVLASLFCLQVFAVLEASARGDDVQKLLESRGSGRRNSARSRSVRLPRALFRLGEDPTDPVELPKTASGTAVFPTTRWKKSAATCPRSMESRSSSTCPGLEFVNRSVEDTVPSASRTSRSPKALEKILEETTPGDQL